MKSSQTPLLVLAAIILAAGAYWYFFFGSDEEEATLSASRSVSEAQAQFQVLISQLSPISFPTEILSDPRFGVLVDMAVPVFPEPAGRPDPFAQLR
ncbi:hypothetical protein HYV30_00885 [Candidatus Kaiserbacteria bacterium]|nr:hypothetical protein [Candidatus Kaiserbacteria bacterium]